MMKRTILFLSIFSLCHIVAGQQLYLMNQYLHNLYIVNPAAAGLKQHWDLNLSYRQQWVGIENSPRMSYLTVTKGFQKAKANTFQTSALRVSRPERYQKISESNVVRMKHGLGGFLIQEKYGAFNKTEEGLSYTLHLRIGRKLMAAIGASATAFQLKLNTNKISFTDPNDNTYISYLSQNSSNIYFDANAGALLYSDNLYFGYSCNQLLQNKVYFGENLVGSKLNFVHSVNLSYQFNFKNDFHVSPGIFARYMNPSISLVDVILKIDYQEKFWGGFSYRLNNAMIGFFGLKVYKHFKLGYSYEYTLSELGNYTSGSHELVLGYIF